MTSSNRYPALSEMFRANVRAHWIYYRRSRIVLVFALLLLVLAVLTALPAWLTSSRLQGFDVMKELFVSLNGLLIFFSASLGLVIVYSHLRARNLKMVFTKPCPPGLWLGSVLAATAGVTLALDGLILLVALVISAVYRIPVQGGLVYIALSTLFASIGMISWLMLLAMVMHPLLAAGVAAIFGPWTFGSLEVLVSVKLAQEKGGLLTRIFRDVFHVCYLALPMVFAYGKEVARVRSSLRVEAGAWRFIPYSLGYAAALAALCCCLALLRLRRKQLN